MDESWRERRDFDGSADWVNGVIGDDIEADALAAPLVVAGNAVDS